MFAFKYIWNYRPPNEMMLSWRQIHVANAMKEQNLRMAPSCQQRTSKLLHAIYTSRHLAVHSIRNDQVFVLKQLVSFYLTGTIHHAIDHLSFASEARMLRDKFVIYLWQVSRTSWHVWDTTSFLASSCIFFIPLLAFGLYSSYTVRRMTDSQLHFHPTTHTTASFLCLPLPSY